MAIYFDNNDPAAVELLTGLGLDPEWIAQTNEIGEEDLEILGINPKSIQLLDPNAVETPQGAAPLQSDYFLSHEAAQEGLELVEHLGGAESFKSLTSSSSCWANNLSYFYRYQVMNQTTYDPPSYAFNPLCPFNQGMTSVMHATVYPSSELPEAIREKAVPAITFLYSQDGKRIDQQCTAVVIASNQRAAYLLTNRHCFNMEARDHILQELKSCRSRVHSELMTDELFVLTTNSKYVPLREENVINRYAGFDLLLLRVPELSGHPAADLSPSPPSLGETIYLLGTPEVYPVSVYTISYYNGELIERHCVEGHECPVVQKPRKLSGTGHWNADAGLYGSVGTIFISQRFLFGSNLNIYHRDHIQTSAMIPYLQTTAMIRPGMSGGGYFTHDGLLVGIGEKQNSTSQKSLAVNGSAGTPLHRCLETILQDIKLEEARD